MRQLVLTKNLLTGIDDIDQDHHTIIDVGNKILNLDFENNNRTIFEESLSFLDAYVSFHFAAEEQIMDETGYPGLKHHRDFHEHFSREISECVNRMRMDGMSKELMVRLSIVLEDWLSVHVPTMDAAFAKYLQARHNKSVKLPDVGTLKGIGKLPQDFNEGIVRGRYIQ